MPTAGLQRVRALREDRGQSIVEFALMLPILVFGLIGGSDLARAFAIQLAIQNGARSGAEAAAIAQAPIVSLASAKAVDEISRTPYLQATQSTVDVKFKQSDGTTDCTPPTVNTPCFVTVRVRYTFNTIIPWPVIPNTANFDRSTTIRTVAGPVDGVSTCTKPAGSTTCN
jgi:Flp pilus assembly protein TadG